MKILILGAGGVGGYLAGRLAEKEKQVTLIARNATLAAIKQKGLIIIDEGKRSELTPSLVTDNPSEAGEQDAIIIATKSYGLDEAVKSVLPCIKDDTIIIPLLNGISARRVIREHTDKGIILDGCMYVFSQALEPGVIQKGGSLAKIVTGDPKGETPPRLVELKGIFENCGITVEVSEDISRVMWMKWLIMLSNAQAASYYNIPIGPLRDDKEKFSLVLDIIEEVLAVAKAEGINMPEDARETTLKLIQSFEYNSTPSLSRDLNTPGKPTEISIFAGEFERLAKKHGIDAPKNRMILEHFKDRL